MKLIKYSWINLRPVHFNKTVQLEKTSYIV